MEDKGTRTRGHSLEPGVHQRQRVRQYIWECGYGVLTEVQTRRMFLASSILTDNVKQELLVNSPMTSMRPLRMLLASISQRYALLGCVT